MRIAVFGTGAVGGYFGARLVEAGENVTFIARGQTLAALRGGGLRIASAAGDLQLQRVSATDDPTTVGPVDAILVATKAWQVPDAARALAPMVGPETMVVPLQNGVEAPRQLAEVVGDAHVLGGLARIIARVAAPGRIEHAGRLATVAFGELDNRRSERVTSLAEAFGRAKGADAEIPPDIHVAMWEKFLFIAAGSGVGAVTRAPFGVLREMPETRAMVEIVMEEIQAVGVAHGVAVPGDAAQRHLEFLAKLPATGTTSMQRDIAEGRPSELESQLGAVVRLGEERGVPTPVSRVLYYALLPLERRARGELSFV